MFPLLEDALKSNHIHIKITNRKLKHMWCFNAVTSKTILNKKIL